MNEYLQMIDEISELQNHKCAICDKDQTNEKMYVDVNHQKEEVLGLLCLDCYDIVGTCCGDIKYLNKVRKWIKENHMKK